MPRSRGRKKEAGKKEVEKGAVEDAKPGETETMAAEGTLSKTNKRGKRKREVSRERKRV